MRFNILITLAFAALLASCTPSVPQDARETGRDVSIFPDYTYVVLPPNIAPCNFHINDSTATEFVTVVEGADGQQLVVGGQDAMFGESKWHSLLEANKGTDLVVTVYSKNAGTWERYKPFTISVAEEPIDEYITYRYIEASYRNYNELSICQRHLTDFDEQPFPGRSESGKRVPVHQLP